MAKQTDIYVKDEGDFSTVIFQSKKAVKLIKQDDVYRKNKDSFYGKDVIKVDIENSSVVGMLSWAVSHNLTMDSEVPVVIQSKYLITDKEAIRKALCYPKSMPDAGLPEKLEHVGLSTFRGDDLDTVNPAWSVNSKFTIGERYPVYYESEGGHFVIGNDGKGYKMTPKAWGRF